MHFLRQVPFVYQINEVLEQEYRAFDRTYNLWGELLKLGRLLHGNVSAKLSK